MSDTLPIASAPLIRRLWLVVTLTCLILTFPLAMIILFTGDVYRWRDQGWHAIGKGARYTYGGLLALWLIAAVLRVAVIQAQQPAAHNGTPPQVANSSTSERPAGGQLQAEQNGLEACTSSTAVEAVKETIEENGRKVLDFGKAQETLYEPQRNLRRCVAEAALNSGQTIVTYQLYLGPSGKQLVQVQTGRTAAMQYEVDKTKKEEAQEAAANYMRQQMAAKESQAASTPADTENDHDVQDQYSKEYVSCISSGEAARGDGAAMTKCLDAEIDYQNTRLKEQFVSKMRSLPADQAAKYRDEQIAWGERMTDACKKRGAAANDPVVEPHCVLNQTIRHLKQQD